MFDGVFHEISDGTFGGRFQCWKRGLVFDGMFDARFAKMVDGRFEAMLDGMFDGMFDGIFDGMFQC